MEEIFVRSEGQGRSFATAFDPERKLSADPASRKTRAHFFSDGFSVRSLASCVLANPEAIPEKNGLPPMDFEIRILKEMAASPSRVAAISLEVIQPSSIEASIRKLLEKAMDFCPVKRSLSEGTVVPLVFP